MIAAPCSIIFGSSYDHQKRFPVAAQPRRDRPSAAARQLEPPLLGAA